MKAGENATDWVFGKGYRNVLIEINNECNVTRYDHDILKPDRVHELIEAVKQQARSTALLVGTSFGGGAIPTKEVADASDFLLLHGNGVKEPKRIAEMVRAVARCRQTPTADPVQRGRSFRLRQAGEQLHRGPG